MIERRFIVFMGVGLVSTIVDVSAIQLLLLLQFHYVVAVSVGFVAGFFVNYLLHLKVTFNSIGSLVVLLRFVSVVVLNYLMTVVCVSVSEQYFSSVMLGKLFSLPFVAVNGYLLSKHWVFRL